MERVGQPQTQVAVELVVRGEDGHAVLFDDVSHLEERDAHAYAEGAGLT